MAILKLGHLKTYRSWFAEYEGSRGVPLLYFLRRKMSKGFKYTVCLYPMISVYLKVDFKILKGLISGCEPVKTILSYGQNISN